MSNIKFGYWRVRGRGQVPRLLLSYTGALWEDVQYTQPDQWFGKDKVGLGLEFPNLPYLIEGDLKMTETSAICFYICQRSEKGRSLLGQDLQEGAKIMNVVGVVSDLLETINKMAYDKDPEALREKTWELLASKLEYLKKFKGNKEWLFDRLTLADFLVSELSHYIEFIFSDRFGQFVFLKEIQCKFAQLPEIKNYYEQPNAIKAPFTAPVATIKF
jgi:glutathione S-transferase